MTPKSMWEGGFYPGTAAIAKSVQLNWRPMLYLIDLANDPTRVAGRSGANLAASRSIRLPPLDRLHGDSIK